MLRFSIPDFRRSACVSRVFWIWLAILTTISLSCYLVSGYPLADRARWAGTAFELLGVGALVWGIDRSRRSLGYLSIFESIAIWVSELRFIVVKRPPVGVSINLPSITLTMKAYAPTISTSGGTVEERLAKLARRLDTVEEDIGQTNVRIEQQDKRFLAKVERETSARKSADEMLATRIAEGFVGDNELEIAGVGFLIVGLILANLSSEVAVVLNLMGL